MLPLAAFTSFVKETALFVESDKVLLAVSGGKDSVLMAQLFKLAGHRFSILHCNFNLRGDESRSDEAFVRALALSWGVPFYSTTFDTTGYADLHKLSVQMAARELRYTWFEKMRVELAFDYIALAHHKSDAVETVLLNLVRGTGLSGLHGILPKNGTLIRPMLFLSREEIDEIVTQTAITFVEDSSNNSSYYARNRIRHQVVPVLKELNPSLTETFSQNINRFAEAELLVQQVVKETRDRIFRKLRSSVSVYIKEIKGLHPQGLLFFELLKPYGFKAPVTKALLRSLDHQSGTRFYSASHCALINREELIVSPLAAEEMNNEEHMIFPEARLICFDNHEIVVSVSDVVSFGVEKNRAYVDAEKLVFPLFIRYKREGDRFMPLGMTAFKKLSDFFISLKVTVFEKGKIPILVNGNGEIIWVVGLRADNRFKVAATTKKVVIFEWLKK